MLTLADIDGNDADALLARYGLALERVADGAPIPGSYWGDPEAGVIGTTVYARGDTPVHSLLHEACHLIVAPAERRTTIHTDASDSQAEEDATCYLQIVLADELPGVGSARCMDDMDAWGYTFRLGSTRAWFERDAEDARAWLTARDLPHVAQRSQNLFSKRSERREFARRRSAGTGAYTEVCEDSEHRRRANYRAQ